MLLVPFVLYNPSSHSAVLEVATSFALSSPVSIDDPEFRMQKTGLKLRAQAEKKSQAAAKKAEKEANKASQQASKPSSKRQIDGNVSTRSKLPRVDEGTVDSEAENAC